jgi:Rubisco LSMT substrate-binding
VPFDLEGDAATMLSYLRVAVADREDLAAFSRWSRGPGPMLHGHPVSARNEAATLAALARACEESLARFPQSLEEDDRLLQDPGLDVETRDAVTVRRGEKRVIGQWLALCRFCAPLLDRGWAELARTARRRDPGWGPFDAYVRTAVIPALSRDPWRAVEAARRRARRVGR